MTISWMDMLQNQVATLWVYPSLEECESQIGIFAPHISGAIKIHSPGELLDWRERAREREWGKKDKEHKLDWYQIPNLLN